MKVNVLWGSETGTAESLADACAAQLREQGQTVNKVDMADVTASQLENMPVVLIITSTWSDGDPPSNAMELAEQLFDLRKTYSFSQMRFSVCGLGDSGSVSVGLILMSTWRVTAHNDSTRVWIAMLITRRHLKPGWQVSRRRCGACLSKRFFPSVLGGFIKLLLNKPCQIPTPTRIR